LARQKKRIHVQCVSHMLPTPQWSPSVPVSLSLRNCHKTPTNRKQTQKASAGFKGKVVESEQSSHHAVIPLDQAATSLTWARRALAFFAPKYKFVHQPSSAIPQRCFVYFSLDLTAIPGPINCASVSKQFSKRRATSAINYIRAIKVPTSDLA